MTRRSTVAVWLALGTACAVLALAGPRLAAAQCSEGTVLGFGCTDYTWQGCCAGGNVLYWCENGYSCRLSCNSDPSCGWDPYADRYQCGTAGLAAPNNQPPYDCDDGDGDGHTPPSDCDDLNPNVYPGADEHCDGIDTDCDGHDDNGFDGDGDGYPDGALLECQENLPPELLDCDDAHGSANPGAVDVPYDGVDQDCDGSDLTDLDGDGYDGGPGEDDCNDDDGGIHPGADEVCDDGYDNDCDGLVDTADPECGFTDDDDDSTPSDDDDSTPSDDDDTSAAPADDDTTADGLNPEPLGFGCNCRHVDGGRARVAPAAVLCAMMLARRRDRRT